MATDPLEEERNWAEAEGALVDIIGPLGVPPEAAKFVIGELRSLADAMPHGECLGAPSLSPHGVQRLQQELIRCYVRLWQAGERSSPRPSPTMH
jgi:hypothetical protein